MGKHITPQQMAALDALLDIAGAIGDDGKYRFHNPGMVGDENLGCLVGDLLGQGEVTADQVKRHRARRGLLVRQSSKRKVAEKAAPAVSKSPFQQFLAQTLVEANAKKADPLAKLEDAINRVMQRLDALEKDRQVQGRLL
jgi:hypothetical protein